MSSVYLILLFAKYLVGNASSSYQVSALTKYPYVSVATVPPPPVQCECEKIVKLFARIGNIFELNMSYFGKLLNIGTQPELFPTIS